MYFLQSLNLPKTAVKSHFLAPLLHYLGVDGVFIAPSPTLPHFAEIHAITPFSWLFILFAYANNATAYTDNLAVRTDNPKAYTDNSTVHTDNSKTYTNNSAVHTDNPKIYTDNSTVHTDNPKTYTDNSTVRTDNPKMYKSPVVINIKQ